MFLARLTSIALLELELLSSLKANEVLNRGSIQRVSVLLTPHSTEKDADVTYFQPVQLKAVVMFNYIGNHSLAFLRYPTGTIHTHTHGFGRASHTHTIGLSLLLPYRQNRKKLFHGAT